MKLERTQVVRLNITFILCIVFMCDIFVSDVSWLEGLFFVKLKYNHAFDHAVQIMGSVLSMNDRSPISQPYWRQPEVWLNTGMEFSIQKKMNVTMLDMSVTVLISQLNIKLPVILLQ